jgi:hypothetical protein
MQRRGILMITIDEKHVDKFWNAKFEYDVACSAIEVSASLVVDPDKKQQLIQNKTKCKQEYIAAVEGIISMMASFDDNIVELRAWYGVRFVDSHGGKWLKVAPLTDVSLVQRDLELDRELTKMDTASLLPAITDQDAEDKWNRYIESAAMGVLADLGVDVSALEGDADEGGSIRISAHAGMRYAQRMLGISNEAKATEHFRVNRQKISERIIEGLKAGDTEHLWTSPSDGKEYYLDTANTMYVYDGTSKTIVTLWESDFGFTKTINRTIILSQIQVIQNAHEAYVKGMEENERAVQRVQNRISDLADKMDILNAELQALKSKRDIGLSEIKDYEKANSVLAATFSAEYNKLFKKQELRGI